MLVLVAAHPSCPCVFDPQQYTSGDRVVAVLYISPKKFIYFLKHPEDPDFRAFRLKFPSSATAKTTSLFMILGQNSKSEV